jgi:hypothetical protein
MTEGFEEITAKLTEEEQDLVPIFMKGFIYHTGKEKAITAKEIEQNLRDRGFGELTGPRVRKIINFIRMNNLVPGLLASYDGYWVSEDPIEISSYIESLRGRISAISAIKTQTENYLQTLIHEL